MIPYLKPYRGKITLTLTLGLLLSGVALATAKLVQIIIDDIFVAKNHKMLYEAPLVISRALCGLRNYSFLATCSYFVISVMSSPLISEMDLQSKICIHGPGVSQ